MEKPLYDSAYTNYRLALEIFRLNKNRVGMIDCLNRMAIIDNIFTRTGQAIGALQECSSLFDGLSGMEMQLAVYEEQLSRAYEDLGDIEESGKHTQKALKLRLGIHGENDARTAYSYMNLARYHSFKKANDSAYFYSQKAYTICKEHPEHIQEIRYPELLLQHAYDSKNGKNVTDELRENHFRRIRKLYYEALGEVRHRYSRPSAEEAAAYQGLANTYNDQVGFLFGISRSLGEACFDSARMHYDRSIAIKRRLYGEHHRSVSVSYYTKGLIYGTHPDLNIKLQAFGIYQEAIRAIVPGYNPTGPFDLPHGLKSSHPYQQSVVLKECYLLLRKFHKSTQQDEYLLHAHAFAAQRVEVWDEIVRKFESRESGSTIWIWGRTPFEDAVMTAFDVFKLYGDSSYLDNVFTFTERGKNNDFAEEAIRSSGNNRALRNKTKDNQHESSIITRKRFVEEVLDDETAYICFVPRKESDMVRDFVLVMTKNRFDVRELKSTRVDSLINAMEGSFQSKSVDQFQITSYQLYDELLFPVLKSLGRNIRRLVLSVDGSYARIPFDALLTEKTSGFKNDFRHLPYLIRKYTITYALSASHQRNVSGKIISEPVRLSVSVPSFYNSSSLLFSERTAAQLSHAYKGDFFIGSSATVHAFRSSIPHSGILQLSTHAESNMEEPGKSVLLFSGNHREDSLYLSEVLRLKLSNPLTVISACETGKGKSVYAEGSKSFARAFAFAGSRSVLSTLWRVDDKASSSLIESFYQKLSSGTEKPKALQEAKLDYINTCKTSESAHPFFWAGLVITGDPQPLRPEKRTSGWTIVLGVGVVAIVCTCWISFYRKKKDVERLTILLFFVC